MTIGELEYVSPGERLRLTVRYASFLPEFFLTEDGVRDALDGAYNVVEIDVDTLVGFRKIIITIDVVEGQQAGLIGRDIASRIRNHFVTVWDASVERYETVSKTQPIGPPSATTTISLVAVAVIVIGGIFVAIKTGVLK